MTDTPAATATSFRALDCARALHRTVLALPALRDSHQTMSKKLWSELLRAVGCPIEQTLVEAIMALDALRAALESSHANRALPGINALRAHSDTIEDFLDQVPLAPAWSLAAPSVDHDLPTSGILFRLRQQLSATVVRRAPKRPSASGARAVRATSAADFTRRAA